MRRLALAALLALLPAAVQAQTPANPLRDQGIAAALATLEAAPQRRNFERGALMTLRAVERALQAGMRHGLIDRIPGLTFRARRGLPRGVVLPSPDALGSIARDLLADLEAAREVLDADPAPQAFVLDLGDVWLDLNANATRDPGEGAVEALVPLLMGRRNPGGMTGPGGAREPAMPPAVRFDAADRDWLVAYTHMVAGAGNLLLAFDPTPVLRDLAARSAQMDSLPVVPEYYDLDALRARLPALEAQIKDARDRLRALSEAMKPYQQRQRDLSDRLRANPGLAEKQEIEAAQTALNEDRAPLLDEDRRLSRERRAATAQAQSIRRILDQPAIGDRTPGDDLANVLRDPLTVLYVTLAALRQQPDVARIHAVRDHWLAMIAANRRFWAAVEMETDNDREWIPNGRQQSALPVTLEPGSGAIWLRVLDEAEAVLQGRLLLPHPVLPKGVGINLGSWLANPAPVDAMAWVQGVGALPHAARGPQISALSWRQFSALAQGRAGVLALWFN